MLEKSGGRVTRHGAVEVAQIAEESAAVVLGNRVAFGFQNVSRREIADGLVGVELSRLKVEVELFLEAVLRDGLLKIQERVLDGPHCQLRDRAYTGQTGLREDEVGDLPRIAHIVFDLLIGEVGPRERGERKEKTH